MTIKDVARRAGVSPGTASRVINGRGYLSAEVRKRVESAVRDLGYHPDWTARLLRGARSRTVGLVIPDVLNVHYTALARAVAEALRRARYELILAVTNDDAAIDRGYLQVLAEKRADGILYVAPESGSNADLVRQLVAGGTPIVELNRRRQPELLDGVVMDNREGARLLTEHLVASGHRRIGMVVGSDATTGWPRVEGYRAGLAGMPYDPALVQVGAFSREHGEAGTRALLALAKPPTAILAASNRILIGALHVLNQAGRRLGEDISIVSFNETEWLSVWNPPISAIDVDLNEMARRAVERLLGRIEGTEREAPPVTIEIPVKLIGRASVRTLRGR